MTLRVGVLLDSTVRSRWVERVLRDVVESPVADLALVVLNEAEPGARTGALDHLVYRLHRRLDRKVCRSVPDAFERVDLGPVLEGVPRRGVTPRQKRFSDFLSKADVAAIREFDLDVALRFGFRILRGRVLTIARHGIWSYHHGDPERYRGGPPCFWEVMEGSPVTGSVLQVLTETLDGGPVLERSFAATNQRSVARNQNHVFWKSTAFVRRALERLAREGEPRILPPVAEAVPAASDRLYKKPGNLESLAPLGKQLVRAAGSKVRDRLAAKTWFVAYATLEPGMDLRLDATEEVASCLARARPLEAPAGRYWADPFIVEHEGDRFLVFEEFDVAVGRGRISGLCIGPGGGPDGRPDGEPGQAFPVLERPYHLSYPFIFRWQGDLYLLPETLEAGRVELYRCERFPDRWQRAATLVDAVKAADPTLVEVDGTWWLFATELREGMANANDELLLYFADQPTGPFTPHPENPVVSDVRSARPAGRPFLGRHGLVRPAQDGSRGYGSAIALRRVTELSPTRYREEDAGRIEPNWAPGLIGTHTVNLGAGLLAVDGFTRRGFGAAG